MPSCGPRHSVRHSLHQQMPFSPPAVRSLCLLHRPPTDSEWRVRHVRLGEPWQALRTPSRCAGRTVHLIRRELLLAAWPLVQVCTWQSPSYPKQLLLYEHPLQVKPTRSPRRTATMPAPKLWVGRKKDALLAAALLVGVDTRKGPAKVEFGRGDWECESQGHDGSLGLYHYHHRHPQVKTCENSNCYDHR